MGDFFLFSPQKLVYLNPRDAIVAKKKKALEETTISLRPFQQEENHAWYLKSSKSPRVSKVLAKNENDYLTKTVESLTTF